MSEPPSIPRRSRSAEESDFDGLRAAGIRLLERLSGETWTDYNLHDPGITILEHLCFGLTDLIYRTDFDVEDHLTGEDGTIDFTGQALHLPEDILPCRPTTPDDYRRRILDCVPGIDDARVIPWPWSADREGDVGEGDGGPGLYQIVLRPAEGMSAAALRKVVKKVLERFSGDRNLGEDVAAIALAEQKEVELVADVEVSGSRPVAEILSDIYRVAEAYVIGRPRPRDPAVALQEGMTIEEIFTGPLGCSSRPLLDEGDSRARNIFPTDIVSLVRSVDGVTEVRNLQLVPKGVAKMAGGQRGPGGEAPLPRFTREAKGGEAAAGWIAPRLAEPSPDGVRLWRDGRRLDDPSDFPAQHRGARQGHRHGQLRRGTTETFYEPPVGEHRVLGTYQSIQQHFPAIYGINAHGVSGSASEEMWLSAFRLKSYLLLFEQLMADFAANLDHLRDLFSEGAQGAGGGASPTYRFLPLGPGQIPGFRGFYGDEGAAGGAEGSADGGGFGPYLRDPAKHLAWVVAQYDETADRRARLQNHLLAVFGESLEADVNGGTDEVSGRLLQSRARLLEQIPAVTRDRGGAVDLLGSDAERAPGFKRRIALLLGMPEDTDFHVLEHVLLRPAGDPLSVGAWAGFYGLQVSVFFPDWVGPRAEEVVTLNCPAHVGVQCFRLTAKEMKDFESLHEDWRAKKSSWLEGRPVAWTGGDQGDSRAVDQAAAELARFVWAMRRAHGA